ncbi:uncharacterized protein LOC115627787 [Scaptodrosophila lebanonensis]|uniref:Uncharacterized protein LOC115627787 n=1 Tax=Drosophila lebanonensis TaxID=7225 RepID=A0A6J2TWC2_DROLE|nr:uncharacterized protein LOC115627787 [Scaptodrosophila lebanonensis]XP_030379468.1 uncharacterized protein LOC115627787 [Scaptodrosophila lebanonensis]
MSTMNHGYRIELQHRASEAAAKEKENGSECERTILEHKFTKDSDGRVFTAAFNSNTTSTTSTTALKRWCTPVLTQSKDKQKSEFRYIRTSKEAIPNASVICANNSTGRNCRSPYPCANQALSYTHALVAALQSIIMHRSLQQRLVIALLLVSQLITPHHALLVEDSDVASVGSELLKSNTMHSSSSNANNTTRNSPASLAINNTANSAGLGSVSSSSAVAANGYFDKLDNLERSVAAVLIKVAYGTTSTTKRSIPDNSYVLGLTTVATPLLTTLRYQSPHQQQSSNSRHRNYELDLERDHALPTSAPNADILKSNNNPTYPNPNRHHSHDRDRHRHIFNSTPMPAIPNLPKKTSGQPPTIPMYPGDIPLYSPPSRSFFTPPLPPEYQNPFADKPTLRGTNSEGLGTNINRRPIPPPSLMPGHERIPFRPPDLGVSGGNGDVNVSFVSAVESKKPMSATTLGALDADRKKALNTPSRVNEGEPDRNYTHDQVAGVGTSKQQDTTAKDGESPNKQQEVLPNIRRILSGSNGKKSDIPEVLLKHVTQRPLASYHHPPSSPIVLIENVAKESNGDDENLASSPNINQSKQTPAQVSDDQNIKAKSSTHLHDAMDNIGGGQQMATTPSAAAAIGEAAATSSSYATTSAGHSKHAPSSSSNILSSSSSTAAGGSAAAAAAASAHTTWTWAWNIHIYLSVVLFTILAVYSLYKMLTYNKLTHLFSQSYFVCIHLILISICITRIFYLCFDAYNIHGSFHIFAAELLLNLPATFLTVSFSVLILFLFLKSLNHKNNRYSALIRPLTVVVGCGVHVVLCITLHYVESYTLQNHHIYFQQQQQQQFYRRQQQQQQQQHQMLQLQQQQFSYLQATMSPAASLANPAPPPRVLTLICQIIYIFICLSLGLLYLYLYRILKRILRSKSQNYIHGYQNLSYAIHITIATALLFVLLAALQIFGAICISTVRPLMTQANIEVDWLQWGYQFSLRLIEIAIITLISWVTGLKTSVGNNSGAPVNGDARLGLGATNGGVYSSGTGPPNADREKHHGAHHHSNAAKFFLNCTSSSSQEQFETDYPAICNANTNLHTYTMRTGKLIYDDSYALNSLGPSASPGAHQSGRGGACTEYQLQEPMYQRPYDTGSIRSAVNHNIAEYNTQPGQRYHMRPHDQTPYTDYMTDGTTDHYENPNFDLRGGSSSGAGSAGHSGTIQKLSKNTASSTTALSSGGSGSSGTSQQQMLLLQSDSCYSEPLQENSSYEFNNFERPVFKEKTLNSVPPNDECWPERHKPPKSRDRKQNNTLERGGYENPERRSSNSTNSYSSSNGGGRYAGYNSYDRGYYNGVRKSGTLNNIVNNNAGPGRAMAAATNAGGGQRVSGAQTLSERQHYYQRSGRGNGRGGMTVPNDLIFNQQQQQQQQQQHLQQQHLQQQQHYQHNSEEDEEDDMISGSNVECTNLINNEHGSCLTDDGFTTAATTSATANGGNIGMQMNAKGALMHNKGNDAHLQHVQNNPKLVHLQFNQQQQQPSQNTELSAGSSSANSSNSCTASSASDSMLVAEQGFLRFRALEDMNNSAATAAVAATGAPPPVGIHANPASVLVSASASALRLQSRSATAAPAPVAGAAAAPNCSSMNGIDC